MCVHVCVHVRLHSGIDVCAHKGWRQRMQEKWTNTTLAAVVIAWYIRTAYACPCFSCFCIRCEYQTREVLNAIVFPVQGRRPMPCSLRAPNSKKCKSRETAQINEAFQAQIQACTWLHLQYRVLAGCPSPRPPPRHHHPCPCLERPLSLRLL